MLDVLNFIDLTVNLTAQTINLIVMIVNLIAETIKLNLFFCCRITSFYVILFFDCEA